MHFAIGLAAGTAVYLPSVVKALRVNDKLAPAFGKWIGTSWALALFAAVPNLLRGLGLPDSFCSGWWMNVFFFHALIDRFKPGGALIGELGIAACMTLQYGLLLVALYRTRHRPCPP
jgi:hypothetical protein